MRNVENCNEINKNHKPEKVTSLKYECRALSIQQKSPVQIFGIFAGRMERVRPLPRTLQTQGMLGETLLFENGGLF